MASQIIANGGVTSPKGFVAGAVYVGVKSHKSYKPDVAILFSEFPATCAALFTTNRFCAAPVILGRELLKSGRSRGVVINSGNANAGTGEQGLLAARQIAAFAEDLLGVEHGQMFVSSTGVIGERFPTDKVLDAVKRIVPTLSPDHGTDAAWAIMTTDRAKKEYACELTLSSGTVRIGAMSKGSGMIHPNMATTLTFITTDAHVDAPLLQEMIKDACDDSMHMLSVDGDTSTNDSLFVFANGASGVTVRSKEDSRAFCDALHEICTVMAKRIAADGEGATRLLTVEARGLSKAVDAQRISRTIVSSLSVKVALGHNRLNWGEIMTAIGRVETDIDLSNITCTLKSSLGTVTIAKGSMPVPDVENEAQTIQSADNVTLLVDFGAGNESASAWGCDFTDEYVHMNGDYRT